MDCDGGEGEHARFALPRGTTKDSRSLDLDRGLAFVRDRFRLELLGLALGDPDDAALDRELALSVLELLLFTIDLVERAVRVAREALFDHAREKERERAQLGFRDADVREPDNDASEQLERARTVTLAAQAI